MSIADELAKLAGLRDSGILKLPASLQTKIQQLQSDVLLYPDRASDISGMLDYIANGDFDMAEYKADGILEAQANLRAAAAGLPTGLKAKLQQIESQRIDYPDRSSDVASMQDYIEEGDFDMAEYKADAILKAQANLKDAAKGLPAGLQAKLNQVESERIDYPDRSSDVASMHDYLANGDFDMAVYKADAILEAQANLKRAANGLPANLQSKLNQVESQRIDYPDRSGDVASMQDYIAQGDFDMAEYKADAILKAQANLKRGIPAALKTRMAEVESRRVDYPDRSSDVASMQDYLANGDFDMAVYKADAILEAQNNLR